MRGLACTSSMKAGRDRASAEQSSMASAEADRAAPSSSDTSPSTSGGRTTLRTARSPVAEVRNTATAPRRSTMSDSPGSFSTKSNCPLRYVLGTAAAMTRWRTSASSEANMSTPVSASPRSDCLPRSGCLASTGQPSHLRRPGREQRRGSRVAAGRSTPPGHTRPPARCHLQRVVAGSRLAHGLSDHVAQRPACIPPVEVLVSGPSPTGGRLSGSAPGGRIAW
jgi:hypothetical protein